jgi:MSHA pilin protein MshA
MQHQKQSGFTLIELIIVIVILGILAVTAAPKFIDIQSDADEATLKGVKGALQGSSQLVYAKSAIAGIQSTEYSGANTPTVSINNETVSVNFGYPAVSNPALSFALLQNWVDLSTDDWDFVLGGASDPTTPVDKSFAIKPKGRVITDYTTTPACYVLFTEAVDANTPATVTAYTGC